MSAWACFVCFWFGMNVHRQHPLAIALSPFTVLTIAYALHCSLTFVCCTSRPQKTAVGLLTLSFVSLYNWLHATPEGQATKIFTAPASLTILWWKPGGAGRIAQVVTVPERSMVTMDMREDRVRIVATRDGNVARVPIVGKATTAICTTLQHSCQLHSPRERTKERQPTKGGKQSGWVLGRSAE